MKKVIFLDIDGVLNTSYTKYRDDILDEFRLDYLAKIVNKTRAKIVLTSTWRYNLSKSLFSFKAYNNSTKKLIESLKERGLKISALLPDTPNNRRAEDISEFIKKHKVTNFVILDDELFNYESLKLSNNLLRTSFYEEDELDAGLTQKMIRQAVQILNKK
jgi:hypothetical protein